jgi:hypothetical protein
MGVGWERDGSGMGLSRANLSLTIPSSEERMCSCVAGLKKAVAKALWFSRLRHSSITQLHGLTGSSQSASERHGSPPRWQRAQNSCIAGRIS